jgi:dolichol-phosphate mannosyltransferase
VTRVLVTGAGGFVGANLAARCLAEGCTVFALLRPGGERWRLAGFERDLHAIEADLRDAPAIARAVAEARPDWVFHTAVYGAYSWETDAVRMVETTVLGTANLLEACASARVEAFVNAGSSSEYGCKDHPPREIEPAEPRTRYAAAKLCATEYCRFFGRAHDLPVTTLRLYSAFGPYEDPARLMPKLIVRALGGDLPPLADPSSAHDFVYIDDVCAAFVLAARRRPSEPGAIYNVGTGVQTTLAELVETAQSLFGLAVTPRWQSMPRRDWDTSVWVADPSRIRQECGWHPKYALRAGLQRFSEWLTCNPAMLDYYSRRTTPSQSAGS